jgi:hypothetical protein
MRHRTALAVPRDIAATHPEALAREAGAAAVLAEFNRNDAAAAVLAEFDTLTQGTK